MSQAIELCASASMLRLASPQMAARSSSILPQLSNYKFQHAPWPFIPSSPLRPFPAALLDHLALILLVVRVSRPSMSLS